VQKTPYFTQERAMKRPSKEQIDAAKIKREETRERFIIENKKGRGLFIKALDDSMTNLFIKAYEESSKAAAIKAKCLDCVCFIRRSVTDCEAFTCPLWEHRPYKPQNTGNTKE